MECTDILTCWIKLALSFAMLFWFMKNTFGFRQRYMKAACRFNYLSDLQIKREYAYERRIYGTSETMDTRFWAAAVNKKSALSRFHGQFLLESILIGITVFPGYRK